MFGLNPVCPRVRDLYIVADIYICTSTTLRPCSNVPEGCIAMDAVQQFNLHLLAGDVHKFRTFAPPKDGPFELVELTGHVRLLRKEASGSDTVADLMSDGSKQPVAARQQVEVDARDLIARISRAYFGRVVAVNEVRELRQPSVHGYVSDVAVAVEIRPSALTHSVTQNSTLCWILVCDSPAVTMLVVVS